MDELEIAKKCASCFVIKDNKILLIYHKKFAKYIQPGGHVENDEEPFQTAIREVLEETGIVVVIDNIEPFNIQTYDTKIGKQLDYQFIGRFISGELKKNEESTECGWFDLDDLDKLDVVEDLKEKILMIRK